jgi:hypothetical protein
MGGLTFRAISTFNAEGLELYGRRMMRTFTQFWPSEVELTVYSEGWGEGHSPQTVRDLEAVSPWLKAFKARHSERRPRDYRMDAVRFSHKVAAVCHAAKEDAQDVLIWLDGDIVTHSKVTEVDLEGLAPKGEEWIAWLDRERVYPECGLFMLNCRHARLAEIIARLEGLYTDDTLFRLNEWHDSEAMRHIVASSGVKAKSLSGAGFKTSHPLANGPLGKFFDHAKGNRKAIGRTPKGELRVRRSEAYWQ